MTKPISRWLLLLAFSLQPASFKLEAAQVHPIYYFGDYTARPLNVRRVTVTPLGPSAEYNGTNLSRSPIIYTAAAYPTLTNGTITISNLVAGYAYRVAFADGYSEPAITNYFGTNLTGVVSAYTNETTHIEWRNGVAVQFYGPYFGSTNIAYYINTNSSGSAVTGAELAVPSTNAGVVTITVSSNHIVGIAQQQMSVGSNTISAVTGNILALTGITASFTALSGLGTGITELPYTGLTAAARLNITNAALKAAQDATNSIPAGALTGTLPNGVFPATLPAASGANLTALTPANISAGTAPINITGNAANLTAGTTINDTYGQNIRDVRSDIWLPMANLRRAIENTNPISIVLVGDSMVGGQGPTTDETFIRNLQRQYGTNGGFSVFGGSGAWYGAWGSGGSYRTNTSGTHSGTFQPWAYGIIPSGGTADFSETVSDAFITANTIHVAWRIRSGGGTLVVKTRADPGFGETTWASINTATGTDGSSSFTNIAITPGSWQLRLQASSAEVALLNCGMWSSNSSGITFGLFYKDGEDTWADADPAGWTNWLSGFQPTIVIAQEKNTTNDFPTFLNVLSLMKRAWPTTDFIYAASQADISDATGHRQGVNWLAQEWCATNGAIFWKHEIGNTNRLLSLNYTTTGLLPHLTTAGNNYIWGKLFEDIGILRSDSRLYNPRVTPYTAGNQRTAGTNFSAYFVGDGSGLSNLTPPNVKTQSMWFMAQRNTRLNAGSPTTTAPILVPMSGAPTSRVRYGFPVLAADSDELFSFEFNNAELGGKTNITYTHYFVTTNENFWGSNQRIYVSGNTDLTIGGTRGAGAVSQHQSATGTNVWAHSWTDVALTPTWTNVHIVVVCGIATTAPTNSIFYTHSRVEAWNND